MKYQTNEIVIIETNDPFTGKIRTVGIIRYYDEQFKAYEVNVMPVSDTDPVLRVMWWTVDEDEIKQSLGLASAERKHPLATLPTIL